MQIRTRGGCIYQFLHILVTLTKSISVNPKVIKKTFERAAEHGIEQENCQFLILRHSSIKRWLIAGQFSNISELPIGMSIIEKVRFFIKVLLKQRQSLN